jgi:hypothetical protein
MTIIQHFIWRLVRTSVALALANAAAWATKDPRWLWTAPIIAAIDKLTRDIFAARNGKA